MSGEIENLTPEASDPTAPVWSGLLESSKRFGVYSWTEMRLFQILGGWALTEADPRLTLMFDDHSRRHSWHSTVWFDRLPELSNVDAEGLVQAPSGGLATLLDELAELSDSLDRLSAGYEVLVSHLIVTYRRELERLDPIGDASARHWLGFILQNLTEELLQAKAELHLAVGGDDDIDRAASICQRMGKKLLASGGLSISD